MSKIESHGYSLWLQPESQVFERFANIIRDLAGQHGGPIFEPHVTLLGEVAAPDQPEKDVVEKTKAIVEGRKLVSVYLTEIDFQDYYFRTLYVLADRSPELLGLYDRALEVFGREFSPYMPHLSLMYGDYTVELKKQIISEIGRQRAEFVATGIHVIKSTGDESTWAKVAFIPF